MFKAEKYTTTQSAAKASLSTHFSVDLKMRDFSGYDSTRREIRGKVVTVLPVARKSERPWRWEAYFKITAKQEPTTGGQCWLLHGD
jgi:hypothetical protein